MLDAHPRLTIPPETYFVPDILRACSGGGATGEDVVDFLVSHERWSDFGLEPADLLRRLPRGVVSGATALRAFYAAYAEENGKPRWGDKTPVYLKHMRRIEKGLPEAHFIHILRDGRDVALSVTRLLFGPDSVAEAARRWVRKVRRARSQAARLQHYTEVRYEDLVADPDSTLRRVCEFIALGWHPAMLEYHRHASERMQVIARERYREGRIPIPAGYGPRIHALAGQPPRADRVGRWRTEMRREDREVYETIAGDLLAELGYQVGDRCGNRNLGRD